MNEQPLGSSYVLTDKLGGGAMGTVYRGRDTEGAEFAFKILRPDLAEDPALVQRFIQERSALTAVDDPHVVRMHGLVVEGSTLAIVMDLVTGGDLRSLLQREGTLAPAEVARIGSQVARGLAAVHRAGVVHRDVKPENVLIDVSSGRPVPRVSDFGIARLADASAATRSTMMLGTPHYMAPEIAEGHPATPAVDAYALGILLYEMCCGVTPFEGAGPMVVMRRHADDLPARPDGIPDPLWQTISDLLIKDPGQRPSVGAASHHLEALSVSLRGAPAAGRLEEPLPPIRQDTASVDGRTTQASAPVDITSQRAPDRKRSKAPLLIGLVLTALLVGGGAYGAMVLLGDDAPVAAEQTPSEPTPAAATSRPSEGAEEAGAATTTEAPTTSEAPTTTAAPTPEAVLMPEVVGLTLSQARTELRGIAYDVVEEFDTDAADNEVLAQSVAVGEEVTEGVDLTVAKQPVTVYLDDLEAVSNRSYYDATPQLNGESYPRSLVGDAYNNTGTAEWNLSRGFRQLVATVGRSDEADNPAVAVEVKVFLDQREVWSERVVLGEPVELDIDVTDALRLRIDHTPLERSESAELVLGDIRLLGLPGEVPEEPEE